MSNGSIEYSISFDERGYLMSYQVVEMSITRVEKMFVADFANSSTRNELLINFKALFNRIGQQINQEFKVWIDGSFTTRKVNPNDIDIVFFIDSEPYEIHETALRQLISREYCRERKLDCYFVRVYPTDHPNYVKDTEADTKE